VYSLDVSVSDLLVFFAGDVRRTRNRAGPKRLTQKVKAGIRFTDLRQIVEFRKSGRLGKYAGPIHLHVFTDEIADQF
jgi:hypothetical protein